MARKLFARLKLVPGGAFEGPVFASLLDRLTHAPKELAPGQAVGPYRIIEPLGRGGMAVVYLAERADGEFQQTVALKVISSERESRAARELLRRERQILAALHHKHIARLLDGGTTDDGLLWFAMEPVRGTRIDTFARDRALSIEVRLRLFLQVCEAVRFAHARLVIHRDLKPSNILVTEDGDVKLLDFGIAIAEEESEKASPALTPGFASPEQRRGESITTASDIWQLGNLLSVLIGEEVARRHADLQAIISLATAAEPSDRYGSASELAADVASYLEKKPVNARRGGPIYRATRFIARHRWTTAAVVLVSAGVIGMAAQFTLKLARERDAVQREAERANAATSFVVELFKNADPYVHRGESIDARELLQNGVNRLETDLVDQPATRAQFLYTIGRIHAAMGDSAKARTLLDEAVSILRGLPEIDRVMLPQVLRDHGAAILNAGDPVGALPSLVESARLVGRDTSEARRRLCGVLDVLSMAQLGAGEIEAAEKTQLEALEIAEQEYGVQSAEVAGSRMNLGIVLRATGTPAESAAEMEKAWKTYVAVLGPDHPLSMRAQQLYGSALVEDHRPQEAQPMLEEAVEMNRRLYGGKGATYAGSLRALGRLSAVMKDHRRAIEYYRQAEALLLDVVDPDSAVLGWTLSSLGDNHEELGEHELALGYFERALEMRRKLLPPDHLTIAQSLESCARNLVKLGKGERARELAREALQIRTGRLSPDSPELARSMLPLAGALWLAGEQDQAHEMWASALALIERADGKDSRRYQDAQKFVAHVKSARSADRR